MSRINFNMRSALSSTAVLMPVVHLGEWNSICIIISVSVVYVSMADLRPYSASTYVEIARILMLADM